MGAASGTMRRMAEPDPNQTFENRPQPRDPDPGRLATIVFGAIIIAIGVWFFADRTLGIDLPDFDWGSLWPLVLIGIGVWILLGAGRRNRA
jgi:LiaI-LiaF-like transmembrane region